MRIPRTIALILTLLAAPAGVRPAHAVAPGEILVADFPDAPAPSRILRFNAGGQLIGIFADASQGIAAPRDIAFNSAGSLYVADNTSVLIFDGNGNSAGSITGFTTAESIAFKSNGELFVSNRINGGTSEIKHYSAAGALLQTWPIPEFDSGGVKPFAREIVFGPNGLLYLCLRGSNDSSNDNLVATLNTSTGAFTAFAASSQQVTQPIGLVFEPAGTILVANDTSTVTTKSSLIVRLSSAGVYQGDFWNTGAARDLFYDGFGQLHGSDRLGGLFLWNANGTLKKTYGASAATAALSGALIPASGPYCQNEILEAGEQCDDGNFTPCDGCTATCHTEFGCGDGSKCGAEACDDGNLTSCDGCSSACVAETCGDGVICAGLGETCDDGNTSPCDGCSPSCGTEQCGNGILDCNEQCDDGTGTGCDGCTTCNVDELAYLDQFESGTNGWSETGLWNQDTYRSVSPSYAWYYGQTTLRNYTTIFPTENSGTLVSPSIDLSNVSGASLSFNYFLQTQKQAGLDVASVEVSRDEFVSDVTTLSSQLPDRSSFGEQAFSLSAFSGDTIQVRFSFDTVDGNANNFEGWYVDDVTVRGTGAPVCGNGLAAHLCSEGCDDGNTLGGDGCSATCQAEGVTDQAFFSGTAQGGSIAITVSGVPLNVTTYVGDSAAMVAGRVSAAINADATLQGMGVSSTWDGSRLDVIAGAIGSLTSNDPGIQATHGTGSVPTTSGLGAALLVFLLLAAAAWRLRRRACACPGSAPRGARFQR